MLSSRAGAKFERNYAESMIALEWQLFVCFGVYAQRYVFRKQTCFPRPLLSTYYNTLHCWYPDTCHISKIQNSTSLLWLIVTLCVLNMLAPNLPIPMEPLSQDSFNDVGLSKTSYRLVCIKNILLNHNTALLWFVLHGYKNRFIDPWNIVTHVL